MQHTRLHLLLERRQVMAFALQQSLKILQLSHLELAERVREEIEQNALLEEVPNKSAFSMQLPDIASKPTLREYLLAQARESLDDQQIAQTLIDHLDERGFITVSLDELPWPKKDILRVLATIQTFDPPGIGARNLQECLLLQSKKQSYVLAEILIRDHYQDLLHQRFKKIQKHLNVSMADFSKALNQISKLRMRPAEVFDHDIPTQWIADLIIKEAENGWIIQVGEEELPVFRICKDYKTLQKQCSREEKETLRSWYASGKWLSRCIRRRREILFKIGRLLLQMRFSYFETGKPALPIGLKELAELLSVHPTTAWRAVANKTLLTPFGMLPLRTFFSEACTGDPVKELLIRLIKHEDKATPLTDDDLSSLLHENGISCARRTISKYRKSLKIGSAVQRKLIS